MRSLSALLVACAAVASAAADFKDVDPNVFPKDDPKTKDLPRMMSTDARKRMQEANLRESKAFADVTTKAQWEAYRDARIVVARAAPHHEGDLRDRRQQGARRPPARAQPPRALPPPGAARDRVAFQLSAVSFWLSAKSFQNTAEGLRSECSY